MNETMGLPQFILSRHWWALLLRGLAALAFGLLTLTWPLVTLRLLVIFFGVFAFADGFFTLIAALRHGRKHKHAVMLSLQGIVGIAVGVISLLWPSITAMAILFLIAFWALITGVLEIIVAFRLLSAVKGKWFLGLSGFLSVIFGLLVVVRPEAGLLSIVWIIGLYAILAGITLIALGFKLRVTQKRE